jgi:hypothetical protein
MVAQMRRIVRAPSASRCFARCASCRVRARSRRGLQQITNGPEHTVYKARDDNTHTRAHAFNNNNNNNNNKKKQLARTERAAEAGDGAARETGGPPVPSRGWLGRGSGAEKCEGGGGGGGMWLSWGSGEAVGANRGCGRFAAMVDRTPACWSAETAASTSMVETGALVSGDGCAPSTWAAAKSMGKYLESSELPFGQQTHTHTLGREKALNLRARQECSQAGLCLLLMCRQQILHVAVLVHEEIRRAPSQSCTTQVRAPFPTTRCRKPDTTGITRSAASVPH